MKIEVVSGQIYSGNKPAANPGDILDLPDAEAQRLIELGVAKKPGAANAPPAPDTAPKQKADKPAEEKAAK
jgi:hypothetical protein